MRPRIFQIGFNKCGTRTFHQFFKAHGLRCIHWHGGRLARAMLGNLVNGEPILRGYEEFEVFSDMESIGKEFAVEAFKLFEHLAPAYPGSIFLLNTRDREAWIRSRMKHGNGRYAARWKLVLGLSSDAELAEAWRRDWDRHMARVDRFFADGRHRLVRFDIEKDDPAALRDAMPELQLNPDRFGHRGKTQEVVGA